MPIRNIIRRVSYNMQGRELFWRIDTKIGVGNLSMSWNANNLSNGHIFCENGSRRVCWHAKTDVDKIILNIYGIIYISYNA